MGQLAARSWLGMGAGVLVGLGLLGAPVERAEAAGLSMVEIASGDKDVIIFRDGSKVEGEILEETDTTVRIRVIYSGLAAETTYDKSGILVIERADDSGDEGGGQARGGDVAADEAAPTSLTTRREDPADKADAGTPRVYVMNLDGQFGRDISQTPIREAMEDARENGADYVICVLENDWSQALVGGFAEEELYEDVSNFEAWRRVEDIDPIFNREMRAEWDEPPTVVFWVKQAMGGAAFLPLICENIYFHSEGRMGGVGGLDTLLEGVGDEVVRQKQYSLRRGHVHGLAILGGYDPRIVDAMILTGYELSYRMEGGRAVLSEGPPGPGEEVLSDNGFEDPDTDRQVVRGLGDDHLTLKAQVALDLGVSKGTVDTLEDLLFELGLERNHVRVDGDAERIMDRWSDGVKTAERRLQSMARDFQQVQPRSNDPRDVRAAYGRQISILEKMIALMVRYEEAIVPQQIGVPPRAALERQIAQIRLLLLTVD